MVETEVVFGHIAFRVSIIYLYLLLLWAEKVARPNFKNRHQQQNNKQRKDDFSRIDVFEIFHENKVWRKGLKLAKVSTPKASLLIG